MRPWARFGLPLMLCLLWPLSTWASDTSKQFRTTFPLYSRVVGGGGCVVTPEQACQGSGYLGASLSLSLDYPEESIWWQMRHHLLTSTYNSGGTWSISALKFQYLRHDLSSAITSPIMRSLRIPAPFDITLWGQLGDFEFTQGRLDRVQAATLTLGADLIRDGEFRHRFAFGPKGSVEIDRRPADVWQVEVVPFTMANVLYGWDQRDGLFSVQVEAAAGASRPDLGESWQRKYQATLRAEWTPLAISDLPFSLTTQGELEWQEGLLEWQVLSGVQLGIPLD